MGKEEDLIVNFARDIYLDIEKSSSYYTYSSFDMCLGAGKQESQRRRKLKSKIQSVFYSWFGERLNCNYVYVYFFKRLICVDQM